MIEPLVHPQFNPIAFSIGPLSVRWYGLMYLLAFLSFFILGRKQISQSIQTNSINKKNLDDLMIYGMLGVIFGGRFGYVIFYQPDYFVNNPSDIIAVWKGGMSFHGGLVGVIVSLFIYSFFNKSIRENKKKNETVFIRFLIIADFVAPLVPLGLFFGRIGNFINGELYGRVTDFSTVYWSMIFPQSGTLDPRHPSQIYQALGEGLILFFVLFLFSRKKRELGFLSSIFLIGYGASRYITEYFREPDSFLGHIIFDLTMGQVLSLPMIFLGLFTSENT